MDISIKKGEGISQAVKRQLNEEGIQDNQFTGSIWSKIQQSLNDGVSVIKHGDKETKIGELWTELSKNVKTYVDDILKIAENTWNSIKSLFTSTQASQGVNTNNNVPSAPTLDKLPSKPDTSKIVPYSESNRQIDTYRTYDEDKTEWIYNPSTNYNDMKCYDFQGRLLFFEEYTDNGQKTHYYDTNGKEVKCIEEDDNGNIISITEYDKNGSILQVATKSNQGWVYNQQSNIQFKYDNDGNCTTVIEYDNDGKKKNVTGYEKGNLQYHQKYDGSNIIGHNDETGSDYILKKDESGKAYRQIYYRKDGTTVLIDKLPDNKYVRYEYDTDGNLKDQYFCNDQGNRI